MLWSFFFLFTSITGNFYDVGDKDFYFSKFSDEFYEVTNTPLESSLLKEFVSFQL